MAGVDGVEGGESGQQGVRARDKGGRVVSSRLEG